MKSIITKKLEKLPYGALSLFMGLSAFGAYTSMYAFRKAFTAATFTGIQFFGLDYKVLLVIAQVFGYMLSKFYGIKFISSLNPASRFFSILMLIGFAWLSLLGFAIVPAPFNIIFLFLNGFPLGMIWGLIFSYLEGRRSTEFMAAILSVSLIFASGFIKTIGRFVLETTPITEFWMPFFTGFLFAIPLFCCLLILEIMPKPSLADQQQRIKRKPMDAKERKQFFFKFLPGVFFTIIIYVLLTIMRDIRDNFEVEIWAFLGINNNAIYSLNDSAIAFLVLIAMALLVFQKNNLKAFTIIHIMIIFGCMLIGIATLLFKQNYINQVFWMALSGLGLYLAYIPYNAIFFDRMIATFKYTSNVGFLMYIADATGYLGSISVLLIKEFGNTTLNWGQFFLQNSWIVALVGGICACFSLIYFRYEAAKKEYSLPEKLELSSI